MDSQSESCGGDISEESFITVNKKKALKRRSQRQAGSSGEESVKKVALSRLQPVLINTTGEKPIKSFNPIIIDRCLHKSIGEYDSCKIIRNGSLLVNCKSISQINMLLKIEQLYDGTAKAIPVVTSLLKPAGAKGVIYNVPLSINDEDLLYSLNKFKVSSVKRFVFKSNSTSSSAPTKTVLLNFIESELPSNVQIGYLNFHVKPYIPKPIRCFKCNRFGHVADTCRGKERCSRCGQGHNIKSCPNDLTKCTNCGGDHAASSKDCPTYKHKAEILYIKTINNISYAEACKQGSKLDSATNNYNLPRDLNVSQSNFPPLPKLCVCQPCPVSYRPPLVHHFIAVVQTSHQFHGPKVGSCTLNPWINLISLILCLETL